ncbi:biotin transporter BioY [Ruminococcus sp. NK3A76]|uniref:biotin transporter BioY n=1 Tax=Ruminococcus sp. NK3A76 TaxID=877411 RepID=UPI00048ACE2C|nr:biotin transporter BioY [Ruminococcus sp. NK3A76]
MNSSSAIDKRKDKGRFSPERIAFAAMFAALICICSWIAVPNPFSAGVSFTLQTFGVILAGLLLSPFEAFLVGLVYMMLGIVGLPVMSGFGTLYTRFPTAGGGYIIGFYITPVLIALARTGIFKITDPRFTGAKRKTAHFAVYLTLAIVIGILAVDIPGIIQGIYYTKMGLKQAIFPFALAFLPTDIVKCVLAALTASALEEPLMKIRSTTGNK